MAAPASSAICGGRTGSINCARGSTTLSRAACSARPRSPRGSCAACSCAARRASAARRRADPARIYRSRSWSAAASPTRRSRASSSSANSTVKHHVHSILGKIGVPSRFQLVHATPARKPGRRRRSAPWPEPSELEPVFAAAGAQRWAARRRRGRRLRGGCRSRSSRGPRACRSRRRPLARACRARAPWLRRAAAAPLSAAAGGGGPGSRSATRAARTSRRTPLCWTVQLPSAPDRRLGEQHAAAAIAGGAAAASSAQSTRASCCVMARVAPDAASVRPAAALASAAWAGAAPAALLGQPQMHFGSSN